MSKTIQLTDADILHLGELSNLTLNHDEIEKYKTQLDETLTYAANLDELDTTHVIPTNHSTDLKNITFVDGEPCTRSLTNKEATANAVHTKDGYFVVPRIEHSKN